MERRKGARSRRIFRRHKESNTGPEEKLAADLLPDSVKEEPPPPSEPEPEPADEDFDIFAGAGEYQGIPEDDDASDSESDGGESRIPEPSLQPLQEPSLPVKGGWFGDAERESIPPPAVHASVAKSPVRTNTVVEEEEEGGRLRALESSALPSIRDFLAMQEAAEKSEKRKARKEKKKKKKGNDDNDD